MQLDRREDGIVHAAHNKRRVGKLAVSRHRAGRCFIHGVLAQIHPGIVQKRRTDPAQSHQGRRAELRTFCYGFEVRERIVGEIARQIERVEDPALTLSRVVVVAIFVLILLV